MAMPIQEPKVGDIVYEAYVPQNPGRIIEILPHDPDDYFIPVKVRWLKEKKGKSYVGHGKETECSTQSLNDFSALVEDHKRKYNNQSKLLKEAEKL